MTGSENALVFGRGIVDALPECACIYLADRDLMIPNRRWNSEIGPMHHLPDLEKMAIDVPGIRRHLSGEAPHEEHHLEFVSGDVHSVYRLLISEVPGQAGVWMFYLRNETELRRVEQLRKDFIANVSHELRTPLTAVKGYLETLLEPRFFSMERVREFLPVIFEHTDRLHNLMLDLLSLSRLESPDTHIELSPLPLSEHLEDAVEATAPLAQMKAVEVELTAPPEDVQIMANPEHLERILVNLLDNAIKYSSPGGKIAVWAGVAGDSVWTHVQDQGPGIAPEELPRVFERFYRTRGALSGKARGSGLGLAIVKHIVQQMDGEIRVSSTVGKGSDFYFSLRRPAKAGISNTAEA